MAPALEVADIFRRHGEAFRIVEVHQLQDQIPILDQGRLAMHPVLELAGSTKLILPIGKALQRGRTGTRRSTT